MAIGRKTGGRQKGTPNKTTAERRAKMEEAMRAIANANGSGVFDGNAHDLLMAIYKNESFPIDFRARCAEAALKYEKPALAAVDNTIHEPGKYIVRMPSAVGSLEEWGRMAAPVFVEAEKAKNEIPN
jgi:hypothetical protein